MLGFMKTLTRGLRQSEAEDELTRAPNLVLREGWGRGTVPRGRGVKLIQKRANGWEKNILDRDESTCKGPARGNTTRSRTCLALREIKQTGTIF